MTCNGKRLILELTPVAHVINNTEGSLGNVGCEKQTRLAAFEITLKGIGISGYTFWVGRESKKLKWRILTGPEKLIVFRNLRIADILGDTEEVHQIQSLWNALLVVNSCLSARPEEITNASIQMFEVKAKAFVN